MNLIGQEMSTRLNFRTAIKLFFDPQLKYK